MVLKTPSWSLGELQSEVKTPLQQPTSHNANMEEMEPQDANHVTSGAAREVNRGLQIFYWISSDLQEQISA